MKNSKFSIKRMVYDAVLVACCAVLGMLSITIGTQKITFENFPILVGAILFGPIDGLLIGGLGTFISQLLRYGVELSTPLWIIPYMISGLFAGLFSKTLKKQEKPLLLLAIVILNGLIVTVCNTISLIIYYQYILSIPIEALFVSLPLKIAISVIKSIVFAAVLPLVIKALRKTTASLSERE